LTATANKITGAKAGEPHRLAMRPCWAARFAQFVRPLHTHAIDHTMKTERRGRIISFTLLVLLSLIALAFAWLTHSTLPTELRGLPAAYKLDAAEMDSLVRVVRTDYQWAFVPLAVVIGAWVVTARVFLRAAQRASVPEALETTELCAWVLPLRFCSLMVPPSVSQLDR